MKNEESIDDYFKRVMSVSNQMRSNGEEMPDSKIVEKILGTLTNKFTYVVVSIEESKDTEKIDEKDEVLLMAYVELQGTKRGDVWFVDSGCSNHMCGESKMFSSLDSAFKHNVKLGNSHKLMVSGKGVVKITLNGVRYVINDVYYVPELKNNLLSVGQLQEKGLDVLFRGGEKNTCSIFHPTRGKIAESVKSTNRMFV
ncbi:PREDICTED: uncharacterized protein LOC104763230 [Camelina sativa]|uniref:Uncharacterized protein LOC104763230 n=1 Tax=Camelina sativa TaxID=90675 RepID=A0ABM0XEY3_CAMSA|nr:PREDICTED: uncharacterized protein LOC104763230 [Camelina sativa]